MKQGKYTVTQAQQIVRETKAMREALLPDFEVLCADAVAAGADEAKGRRLVMRLRKIAPLLFRPEAAPFREKYGKLLLTVLQLTSRLTNDFLLEPRNGKIASVETLSPGRVPPNPSADPAWSADSGEDK